VIRRSLPLLMLVGFVTTLGPGTLAFVGLRAAGMAIGAAGIISILVMMGAMTAYCGWLFAGGHSRS
jgi:hypothetical protein